MRPVNLIPLDQRRGDGAPTRAGAASYILVAVLVAVLLAVTGMVLTGNDVKDKEAALASLEATQAQTEARADALSSFASFQEMKDSRVETVASLAESRFDWERVMRELSLVLPDTVWLTSLTGSVAPELSVPEATAVSLRESVPGPALSMVGCARSQQDVAGLISAIGDIDGVTRVLVERSEKAEGGATSTAGGVSGGASEDCRTRDFIAKFELVAAFDEVVAGAAESSATTDVPATAADATTTPAPSATTTSTDAPASVPEEAEAKANTDAGIAEGKKAAGLIGAGDGG